MKRFILASASPRRRQLLSAVGLEFDVVETGVVEEPVAGELPNEFALRMASSKALAASALHVERLVLGADTVVELEREIIGKPRNSSEARSILGRLSGRTHTVVTAFALARGGTLLEREAVISRVSFRVLSDEEIQAYILSREPFDKAGAYGVQGLGRSFVERLEGSFSNVMGLPLENVLAALKRHLSRSPQMGMS